MVTAEETEFSEISLLLKYLKCDEEYIEKLINDTRAKYPYVESKRDLVHMVAKERDLAFTYSGDQITGIGKADLSSDIDLANFNI